MNLTQILKKNLILWTLCVLICNLFTIYFRLISDQLTSEAWYVLGNGFFLQLPVLVLLVAGHTLVDLILIKFPRSVFLVISFIVTSIFIFILIGFYFVSEEIFKSLNIFLSLDDFATFFTDTKQISLLLLESAAVKLYILIIVAVLAGIFQSFLNEKIKPHTSRSAAYGIGVLASILCFGFIWSLFSLQGEKSIEIKNKSFPLTYAQANILELGMSKSNSRNTANVISENLDPIIPLHEYRERNQLNEKPNIFIILLEAVSADHIGFNGYFRRDISPHIDKLSEDCLVFINTYAASTHSNYAQTSIHSSQYPRRTKSLDLFKRIDYPKTLLFDILGEYGYETVVMSAQNENWQGMKKFLLTNSKIDYFFHAPNVLGKNIDGQMKLEDAFLRETAEQYIKERTSDSPLFMYINFQATHFPYELQKGAQAYYQPYEANFPLHFFRYPRNKVDVMRNRFDNALRHIDLQVGLFIKFLKENDLYDNSILVLAPDHGEAFYEKDYPTHGTSFFEHQAKTFLLIKTVGAKIRGLRKDAVSLIDINPSILELLGLENHPNFQGRGVINRQYENRRIFMTMQGLIQGDGVVMYPWKYFHVARVDGERLINLELDPEEKIDFAASNPEMRKRLKAALDNYIFSQMIYYSLYAKKYYPPKY